MKHIKKQTYNRPVQAVTVDVLLTLFLQILEAVRTLLETRNTDNTSTLDGSGK
ncbi:MAG TPA: hypothetical protein PLA12_00975 [Candidatus Hydrogenedens sp.]|nr:hypothetical protein [Candidatus Hydrogenedens sp.]